jgi:hypothetical protein
VAKHMCHSNHLVQQWATNMHSQTGQYCVTGVLQFILQVLITTAYSARGVGSL